MDIQIITVSEFSLCECVQFGPHMMDTLAYCLMNMSEEFQLLRDDEARIRFVYEELLDIQFDVKTNTIKNIYIAIQEKNYGNNCYMKKEYKEAILAYNTAIIRCPQDADPHLRVLCITIANRSATYFELKEYEKVLKDLFYIEEIGKYPDHLQYKLRLRKAKVLEALGKSRKAVEAYYQALQSINLSNLEEESRNTKRKEIKDRLAAIENEPDCGEEDDSDDESDSDLEIIGGEEYPAAIAEVHFDKDNIQGRFAVAKQDIKQGSLILMEEAYVVTTNPEFWLINCHYCCLSADQPIACPRCCNVVFCSTNCQMLASSYHDTECSLLDTFLALECRARGLIAMRLVTQHPYSFFESKRNYLLPFFQDNCQMEPIRKETYRSDDYDNIFFLCRNEKSMCMPKLLTLTCIATQYLRILKLGSYFPFKTNDKIIKDEEVYIGALILRHLELVAYNTHGIFELKNESNPLFHELAGIRDQHVGGAIFPTLSLFNHSCNPNISRYHVGRRIVVRTIKAIKAGDVLYDNYGPNYCRMPGEERKRYLYDNYCFDCNCPPCAFQWPTFEEMKQDQLRVPCETEDCPFVFIINLNCEGIPIQCGVCQRPFTIREVLLGCMIANEMLKEPETLVLNGEFEEAIKKFFLVLDILGAFTTPPHPLLALVEDRIHLCMLQLGNKRSIYIK